MTEPTTIEKIDAMLAWLDEGSNEGPFAFEKNIDWAGVNDFAIPGVSIGGYFHCSCNYTKTGPADARNIAALLNGIRPMLNVAMCLYQDDLEDTNIPHIIEPLWQAFKEARNETA